MAAKVYLVGAGPGDPELLTLKAVRVLGLADVVVYDALLSEGVLAMIPERAERIFAGKRQGRHSLPQDEINRILVEQAEAGRCTVRLKGGDPFVFGRGGEEILALVEAGIDFEVVPGITAGLAVPAYAGIPVTHRAIAQEVTFITGHPAKDEEEFRRRWTELGRLSGTIVVYMGLNALETIVRGLALGGRPPSTPVAVISEGTTPNQRAVVGTLGSIVSDVAAATMTPPALLVVGDVVALSERLRPSTGRSSSG